MASSVYRSAAQVTAFSTVEKSLSFAYRIILSRFLGAEGVGIYQICLSVFSVFLTMASSGIPVTVSRMIARQTALGCESGKHAVVTAGVLSTLMFTLPAAVIIFFGREALAFLFPDRDSLNIFTILLPGLVLTSVYAVMRGAFWGNKQFLPYSLIELAEDSVMVVLGTVLAFTAVSPADGAMKATAAALISYVFSFFVSVGWYLAHGGRFTSPKSQLKPLLASAMPITAMRTSTSLLNSVVATFLPALLIGACGYDNSQALAVYGAVTGMSLPVLFIPNALIGSIAVVVAPEMSENYYAGKTDRLKRDVERTIKGAMTVAALLAPVLFAAGEDLGVLLFDNAFSGRVIRDFAFMLMPMCVSMITTTVLNSMNCEVKTLIYFFIGALFMLACIFILTPFMGVYSYMTGLAGSNVITAVLNVRLLRNKCKGVKCINFCLKSLGVSAVAAAFGSAARGLAQALPTVAGAAVATVSAAAFAVCGLLALGLLDADYFIGLVKGRLNTAGRKERKVRNMCGKAGRNSRKRQTNP